MFGNPETTPGGLAMKFYASIRMDVRKIETLKKDSVVIGSRVRVKVVKNKVSPPFREAEFTIVATGIDRLEALIDTAIAEGVIVKAGAFLKHADKTLAQGKDTLKDILMTDDKLRQTIVKEVREKMKK
jgi:recombination protein RecA